MFSSFTFSKRLALHFAILQVWGTIMDVEIKVLNLKEGSHGRISRGDLLSIFRTGPRHVHLEEAFWLTLLRTLMREAL